MRANELNESAGDIGRRWLETLSGKDVPFLDKNDNEWEIIDVQYFPPNPRFKYEDEHIGKRLVGGKDFLLSDVANYLRRTHDGASLNLIGSVGRAGLLVVVLNQDDDTERAFLKLYPQKRNLGKQPLFWQTNFFAKETGLVPQTPQMKKAMVPLEPSALIVPGRIYSVNKLILSASQNAQLLDIDPKLKKGVTSLLMQVWSGTPSPVPGLAEFRPVIEVKLGEIAAPIAIASGTLLAGQWKDAQKNLFEPSGYDFSTPAQISFPGKQEKLVDSYLHLPNGNKIAISSKAGGNGGAKPSTAIIAQTLADKKDEFAADKTFQKKFKTIAENIVLLDELSAIDGPLALAVKFDLITKEDSMVLRSIYGKGKISDRKLRDLSPHLFLLYKSSNYSPDSSHIEYQTGYHLLAIIARMVAIHMNKDSARLTQFFKAVLNKSDLLQVLAKTTTKGDAVCFKEFRVIYPPTFTGHIKIDAESYTSRTKPSRKISFSFQE